jgi:HD superfamily phosphohydrolase
MYRTVYWHRQVRSATAMVKKALLQSLESGLVEKEELYDLDDQSLFALLQNRANGKGKALTEAVREGRIYVLAAEIPFQEESQADLRDIHSRSRYEEQLASEFRSVGIPLCAEDVIIDVPEPASFETGLFVLDEGRYFADSSSAFKAETVNAFVQSVYTVRVFVNPLFEQKVKKVENLNKVLKF